MPEMSPEERRAFLSEGTRTGMVATTRKDGRPHVVPIWFVLDGDDLLFTTYRTSVKGNTIRRDGRICVCVEEPRRPYAFVMLEGTATLPEPPDDMLAWSTRIARRYMGDELAKQYGERNAGDGMMLVRLSPEHVLSENNVTGE